MTTFKLAEKIYPFRQTDLWNRRSDCEMDILSDAGLYLNHYRLNETAAFIWNLCDNKHSVLEISEKIIRACKPDAPPLVEIVSDVLAILQDLKAKKVIDWAREDRCDVLLVAPPFPLTYDIAAANTPEYSAPPIGLAYIAAFLRQAGITVDIIDLHVSGTNSEEIVRSCRRKEPKIIGITANTPTYPNALRTALHIKAWNPEITIVLGGVHASGIPQNCLTDGPFDFIVLGEGEVTMLELCRRLLGNEGSLQNIKGIAYRDSDGNSVHTSPRLPICNLDILPFPARDLLDIHQYAKKGAICTSRGCPNNCMFCACNLIFGRQYRTPSVQRVVQELVHLYDEYGIYEIDFNDDTFNWIPERVFELCKSINDQNLKLRWSCFCRAAQMTPDMAISMQKAGCGAVQFGVESGSQDVLKSIGKNTGLLQIEEAVSAASKAGIEEIVCGIIIGHPQDTLKSVEDTFNYAEHLLKIGATRIMMSLLTPYPGTQAYNEAEQLGIRFLTHDWEKYIFSKVVMETDNLSKEELRSLYVRGLIRFLKHEKNRDRIWRPV